MNFQQVDTTPRQKRTLRAPIAGLALWFTLQGLSCAPAHRHIGDRAERGGIEVSIRITANVYTWTVHNLSSAPVTDLRIPQTNCYDHMPPPGWKWSYENSVFHSWTDDVASAVQPGGTAAFSTRVSSSGAVLGLVQISVGTSNGQDRIVFEQLWAPVPKPISLVVLVAGTVAVLAISHTTILTRMRRRSCINAERSI